jgi:hypothetical protein
MVLTEYEYFEEEYDYLRDVRFVIDSWIDNLNANNYNYGSMKKYNYQELAHDNQMIVYFPQAAMRILEEA